MRAWCGREFAQHGIDFLPVQANMQFNPRKGTVRGLHLQIAPAPEAKLVRCTRGAIFDVAVDLRPDSSSFGQWCRGAQFDDPAFDIRWPLPVSAISEQDRNWPLVEGFAHGPDKATSRKEAPYER